VITEKERSERIAFMREIGQHLIGTMENRYRGRDLCYKFRPVIGGKIEELCEKLKNARSEQDIDAISDEYTDFVVKITGN
jgi:uncharacterized protein YbjQ (UPF0145 family)